MPRDQQREPRQTFLVEHYRPGRDVTHLTDSIAHVREAVAEMEQTGESVRYVSATIVPSDESFLCVIEATSKGVVADVYGRAEIPFDRISAAICLED